MKKEYLQPVSKDFCLLVGSTPICVVSTVVLDYLEESDDLEDLGWDIEE